MKIRSIFSKSHQQSRSGFTLVELLIATGILSVLMLGFTGYMFYQARMTKLQESNQSFGHMQSSILNATSQEEAVSQSEKLEAGNAP